MAAARGGLLDRHQRARARGARGGRRGVRPRHVQRLRDGDQPHEGATEQTNEEARRDREALARDARRRDAVPVRPWPAPMPRTMYRLRLLARMHGFGRDERRSGSGRKAPRDVQISRLELVAGTPTSRA